MTATESPIGGEGDGGQFDAPNQQVVRPDESAPWDEGEGGTDWPTDKADVTAGNGNADDLDAMTKAELLDYADSLGVNADDSMTKAEIRALIDQAEGR